MSIISSRALNFFLRENEMHCLLLLLMPCRSIKKYGSLQISSPIKWCTFTDATLAIKCHVVYVYDISGLFNDSPVVDKTVLAKNKDEVKSQFQLADALLRIDTP